DTPFSFESMLMAVKNSPFIRVPRFFRGTRLVRMQQKSGGTPLSYHHSRSNHYINDTTPGAIVGMRYRKPQSIEGNGDRRSLKEMRIMSENSTARPTRWISPSRSGDTR